MSAKQPENISAILKKYFRNKDLSSQKIRAQLVVELQAAYDSCTTEEKVDVLVPAYEAFLDKEKCIRDIPQQSRYGEDFEPLLYIAYAWAIDIVDGFNKKPKPFKPKKGMLVDRIGDNLGTFVCLVPTKRDPYDKYERAIPYYIPEDDITQNPAYHIYKLTSSEIKNARIGDTAPQFWDLFNIKSGGAKQIKFSEQIRELTPKKIEEIIGEQNEK